MANVDTILEFDSLTDPPGIEIIDRLEQLRYQLHTPESVSPTPVSPDEFLFPVGKGLRVTTEELILPDGISIFVRDGEGNMVTEVGHLDTISLDEGRYILDLSTQIKTYLVVEGPAEITAELLEIRIDFEQPTTVEVGFRSRHTRPAATVTTTTDPEDMMAAVSTFGSALKSTSPERSFPTLRGHPPTVELGSSLSVPDRIDLPDTGIEIQIPPAAEYVFPAASLAYYLGAAVVPGERPQLVTESGFEYSLEQRSGYESTVEETLKQVFLLDCLTRTEGFYEVALRERRALEGQLDLDWGELYEQEIADRVRGYLQVPYEILEAHVPQWRLTAHVEPAGETVEQLPFVVNDLAVVRTRESPAAEKAPADSSFSRAREDDVLTRSASTGPDTRSTTERREGDGSYITFESTDSLEQGWIGDGIPIGASKLTKDAFYNRLEREVDVGDISITIVVNDPRMDAERDLVDDAYGDRDNLPFDVTVRRDLTVDGLRDQLRESCDFLHYIGHIDADGFECTDGKLDVGAIERTGVDAFLLNACSSYEQGLRLIESGAIGGIVTLTDVINDEAVQIGEAIAKLLNAGFPLRAALTIAREESILGGQYIVVGAGGMTVTQSPSRAPNLLKVESSDDSLTVDIQTYATDTAGLGSIYIPHIAENDEYILCSSSASFSVSEDQLQEFLELQNTPIMSENDGINWSFSVQLEDLI